MRKDQMTPKERMTAFAQGLEIDRIPCNPHMGVTMAPFIGITLKEYYHSAERMAELEIALFEKLRHDGVSVSATLRGVAEAMGSKMHYPDNNISLLLAPAVNSVDEIESLKPSDPEKDGKLPLVLKAIKIIKDKIGDEVNVGAGLAGPFSTAASVVGTENLLKWMLKYPKKVHTLMEIVTESNNRFIEKAAELGIGVGFSDPVSSTSLISVKQFNEFSAPYIKKSVDKMKSLTGRSISIHICGTSKGIWESVMDTGVSSFSIDNVEDLAEAKKIMGDRITISGNVPPVDVMQKGTREDVLRAAKECIKKTYGSKKGYILSSGCQIPMYSPMENIDALMDAVRIYGSYPINEELLFSEE
ncbi:uroporphyrinogen decarboxylase family protein [Tissierella sp. MSJ-40]|uniref:Uroporphyrinogen decarboxylase family protein n=1 Tax=Tissierella simiarum TaxID=2841534 RepID=A0ABS6E2Q5_9FIRM|nr:uroporphyrinogen decarboxylase family protein [Tissierella simiarum]MBU5436554.1 uroporphyrinogen decarboxylase family protein [Tissierella simiarum]